jgi:hypothetical protein
VSILFLLYFGLSHAQEKKSDQALLNEVRAKYDAPFNRNLESFDCAIEFSWKDHFKETTRVGDEGTDEELEQIFQPIRNRVTVTARAVNISSGFTDDEEAKLPHGGMAEGLLKHAVQKSLYEWLPASLNMFLPNSDTPVSFKRSGSGYKLAYKMQNSDVEMALDSDMRVQSATLKGPQSTAFGASFVPGPQGFLLNSISRFEDGYSTPGHRLSFAYTYQTVEGIQLPEEVVVVRESHHELWQYKLVGCTVKTRK